MRVLYCVNNFPSISQTFIQTQVEAMRARGHDVHVFSALHNAEANRLLAKHPSVRPLNVRYAPTLPDDLARRLGAVFRRGQSGLTLAAFRPDVFGWRRWLSLRRALVAQAFVEHTEQIRPDLVHVHFATNGEAPLTAALAGRLEGAKLLVSFHGFDLAEHPPYYRRLMQMAHGFTVNSRFTARLALQAGCPPEKTHLLPVSLDCARFRRSRPRKPADSRDPVRFLFVGRLVDFKGPDVAVRAFARIQEISRRPCFLEILGDGPLRAEVHRLVSGLGLSEAVVVSGSQPNVTVRDAMERADVFLLPGIVGRGGRQENQGLVIQEAQAMELPVICSSVGGVAEGVRDGETGYVVPPGDVEAVAVRMKALAEDDVLRRTLGLQGRLWVVDRFDAAQLAETLEKIYRDM